MSSEQVNIKVKLKGDDSEISKIFDKIGRRGKEGSKFPTSPSSPQNSNNPNSSSNRKTVDRGSFREQIRESFYNNKHRGEGIASGAQQAISEGKQGAFYSTLSSSVESMRNFMVKHGEKNKEKDSNEENKSPESASKAIQNATIEITNANFKDIKNGKGPSGSSPDSSNGGNRNIPTSSPDSGDEPKGRGSFISKAASSLPFVGGVIAAATAGMLKLVSDVGQKHTEAIMSQASTIGATGGYFHKDQGMFSNAELAQAVVQRGRVTGRTGAQERSIDDQELRFASSQGVGASEVMTAMARLRKGNPDASLNWFRGAATESGFSGLKQSEFLSKMSEISQATMAKGYSGDMMNFARFSSGIGMSDGSDMNANARMGIAESLAEKARQGLFGGGVLGAMGLAKALESSNGDIISASKMLEEDPRLMGQAFDELSPEAKWLLGKKELGVSSKVAAGFKFDGNKEIRSEADLATPYDNQSLRLDNEGKNLFAGEEGKEAAKIGYELTKSMHEMFRDNKDAIMDVSKTIQAIEKPMLESAKMVASAAGDTIEGMKKLADKISSLLGIDVSTPKKVEVVGIKAKK